MAFHEAPQFGVRQGFMADRGRVDALKSRLIEAGVKSCVATFVDVYGVPKAKLTPIESFEHLCDGSELYTVGACEGMGLAGPQEEDECATVPDLDSAIVLPWDRSKAWFSSDLHYHGEPYAGDSRGILKRVLARAERLGLRFNLGSSQSSTFSSAARAVSSRRSRRLPSRDPTLATTSTRPASPTRSSSPCPVT